MRRAKNVVFWSSSPSLKSWLAHYGRHYHSLNAPSSSIKLFPDCFSSYGGNAFDHAIERAPDNGHFQSESFGKEGFASLIQTRVTSSRSPSSPNYFACTPIQPLVRSNFAQFGLALSSKLPFLMHQTGLQFSTCSHINYSSDAASSLSSSPSLRIVPPNGFLALNEIKDKDGSRKQKTRLGRGIGSGKGKTCGRGHKGQKARTGRKPKLGFEGGQTPLRLRLPKRGFHNPFSLTFQVVNVGDINRKIGSGDIDPTKLITMKTLRDVGLSGKKMKNGVKLLARGAEKLKAPINIEVSRVSAEAKAAVEACGGRVTRVHYNKLGLRALLKPGWFTKKHRVLPRPARPPPRLVCRVDAIGRLPAPITPLPLQPSPTSGLASSVAL